MAHKKKLSSRGAWAKQEAGSFSSMDSIVEGPGKAVRCCGCNGRGH